MSPIIVLIRHAEAEHSLTELGKAQCQDLAKFLQERFPLVDDIGLIVTSPLKRTLETTDIALRWLIEEKKIPVILKPEWQETTDKPCDTGRPVGEIKSEPRWQDFDFSAINSDKHYPSKAGPYAYTQDALVGRIGKCLKWLQHRPEKVVCVVSHSGFMRRLSGRKFGNADFRVFEFNRDNEFKERDMAGSGTGGRGLSPSSPSRPKEHWAGIKKSSSIDDLSSKPTASSSAALNGDASVHDSLEIPDVPLRPNSR